MSASFICRSSSQPSYVQEPNFSSHLWMSKGNQRTSTLHVLIKIPETKAKKRTKEQESSSSAINLNLNQLNPAVSCTEVTRERCIRGPLVLCRKPALNIKSLVRKNHSFISYLASSKDRGLNSTTLHFYIEMVSKMLHHNQECALQSDFY